MICLGQNLQVHVLPEDLENNLELFSFAKRICHPVHVSRQVEGSERLSVNAGALRAEVPGYAFPLVACCVMLARSV